MADGALAATWLMLSTALAISVALRVGAYTQYESWTTLWESAPLAVAWQVRVDQPVYTTFDSGPVRLAIYGPLYYQLIGQLGRWLDCDRLALVAVGRWLGVAGLLASVIGVIAIVRRAGAPWWAAAIAIAGLGFLTPTAVRFIGSSRPDSLAVAFSVFGLLLGMGGRRSSAIAAGACLLCALMIKPTAIAAAITLMAVLWIDQRRRRGLMIAAGVALSAVGIATYLSLVTEGGFLAHVAAAATAPVSWHYAWEMFRAPIDANEQWMMLVALVLAWLTGWRFLPSLSDNRRLRLAWQASMFYCGGALFVAMLTATRQGGDQNYLMEPAIALGCVLALWAYRAASVTEWPRWALSRLPALVFLVSPLTLYLPDRMESPGRAAEQANILSPYGPEAIAWFAGLPRPVLCLDSWLDYISDGDVFLSDPIAYTSMMLAGADDPISELAKTGYFATIVLIGAVEQGRQPVYGDIPRIWPRLAEIVTAKYESASAHRGWTVYRPRAAP